MLKRVEKARRNGESERVLSNLTKLSDHGFFVSDVVDIPGYNLMKQRALRELSTTVDTFNVINDFKNQQGTVQLLSFYFFYNSTSDGHLRLYKFDNEMRPTLQSILNREIGEDFKSTFPIIIRSEPG